MTKALRRAVDVAHSRLERATDAIYSAAYPRRDVPFSECRAMASAEIVAAYESAWLAHRQAEDSAIEKGRAWRASYGLVCWR